MQQIHTRHTIEGAINHVAKKSCEFKSKTLFFRQLELNILIFYYFSVVTPRPCSQCSHQYIF